MHEPVANEKAGKTWKSSWWWPGAVVASVAGAAAMALRGCWHSNMSWPVNMNGLTYQVCVNCGAIRLFDEKNLKAYGPIRYDLDALVAWQRSTKGRSRPV